MTLTIERIKHLFRNKRKNIIIFGIIIFSIFYYYQIKEPVYDGKSVSEWIEEGEYWFRGSSMKLRDYSSLKDIEKLMAQYKAYLAIKSIGPSATPYLERILKMKQIKFTTRTYMKFCKSQYLPQFIRNKLPRPVFYDTTSIKLFAACTLLSMNMSSYEKQNILFETLIKSFEFDLRSIAFIILQNKTLTNEQITKLIDQLYWRYHDYRDIFSLSEKFDFKGTNLLKYFIPFLTNENPILRQQTVLALIRLRTNAQPALQNLMITATNDSNIITRLLSIHAIKAMGPAAKEAGTFLSSLTNTELNQIPSEILDSIKVRHAIDLRN